MFDVKKSAWLLGVAVLCIAGCQSVYEETKEKADAGDAGAQYKVARMLLAGENGAEQNPQLAEKYMQEAKKQKNPSALRYYMQEICKKRDVGAYDDFLGMLSETSDSYPLGISYFVILMEDGHTEKAMNLRKLLREKSFSQMKADLDKAKTEIAQAKRHRKSRRHIDQLTKRQKALAESIALVDSNDGKMYYFLQKRSEKSEKAREWHKKAYDLKYPLAAFDIMRAIGASQSPDKADDFAAAVAVCFGNKKYTLNDPGMAGVVCLEYFKALVKKKKDNEAWTVQKALRKYAIPYFESQTAKFKALEEKKTLLKRVSFETALKQLQKELGQVVTAAEKKEIEIERQKKIAELEKNTRLRYPLDKNHSAGIKLSKTMFSGTSLEYLKAEADIEGEEMQTDSFLAPEPVREKFPYRDGWRRVYQYLYAPAGGHDIVFGMFTFLSVQSDSIIAKYRKEFPGIKVHDDRKERLAANRKKILDTYEGRMLYNSDRAEFERQLRAHTLERFVLENDRVYIFIRADSDILTGEANGRKTIIVIDKKYESLCAEACKKARADAAAKKKAEEEKKLDF